MSTIQLDSQRQPPPKHWANESLPRETHRKKSHGDDDFSSELKQAHIADSRLRDTLEPYSEQFTACLMHCVGVGRRQCQQDLARLPL